MSKKRSSLSSSSTDSDQNPDLSVSNTYRRQLQQLFHLHDSGLINVLPEFLYKDITDSKKLFDCTVCLSEFSEDNKLRLLPAGSHAFHVRLGGGVGLVWDLNVEMKLVSENESAINVYVMKKIKRLDWIWKLHRNQNQM
ncbi:hypothetical protein Bca52824_015956 [Brassica carinata]|uniref:RING-type E3 ubiquitin transferase n=1 Tax=Brassica carinata TaxID=52824 RepID=A0A8X7W2S6_BRACI|nr:hypothetical protein Bca52824_015956 [Brassica carinata]